MQSWLQVVFNPSFPYRLAHVLLASGLTVAFVLAGVSTWQLLKGKANPSTARVLRTGLTLGAVLIPLQIVAGDLHGLNTLKHQPQKVAAMEGIWQTERGSPLLLFAWSGRLQGRAPAGEAGVLRLSGWLVRHGSWPMCCWTATTWAWAC